MWWLTSQHPTRKYTCQTLHTLFIKSSIMNHQPIPMRVTRHYRAYQKHTNSQREATFGAIDLNLLPHDQESRNVPSRCTSHDHPRRCSRLYFHCFVSKFVLLFFSTHGNSRVESQEVPDHGSAKKHWTFLYIHLWVNIMKQSVTDRFMLGMKGELFLGNSSILQCTIAGFSDTDHSSHDSRDSQSNLEILTVTDFDGYQMWPEMMCQNLHDVKVC